MYKGILHTHTLVVLLFILLYIVKTFLLVSGKDSALKRVTEIMKWPERIISFLFLGTGIYLYVNSGNITWMVNLKILLVLASIPLAIIGFKKRKSVLAIGSVLLLLVSYGLAEMNKKQVLKKEKPIIETSASELETGKALYSVYCVVCHGEKGDAGLSGAKNLAISILSHEEKQNVIQNGKGSMPGFKALSLNEVDAIIKYSNTFEVK